MKKYDETDLDDGQSFLAWACNIPPKDAETGHKCKFCGIKTWKFDICWKCAIKKRK